MTVNVSGRGRRRGSGTTASDAEPGSKPATRRRGGSAQAVEALEVEAVEPEAVDAAEPVEAVEPAPAPPPDPATRSPLEAIGSVGRLASIPAAIPAPPAAPAPSTVPEVPREAPAVLHASDRRGYTPPPPPRLSDVPAHHQMAIGEINQTLFDCPSCRRPLALGTRRCPGCGIRLIRGIPLTKAVTFVVVGVLVGTMVGVGTSLVAAALGGGGALPPVAAASQGPGAPAESPGVTGGSPSPTTSGTSNPSSGPVVESMPAAARVALGQALEMNARLGTADAELRAVLAAKQFDATAAAQAMRAISADMVFAEGVATRVSGWSGSADVGAQLGTFYASVHETAGAALLNSVKNVTAYRSAARSMVQVLAQRTALDESVRTLATAAGVSLPEPATAP